MSLAYIALGSNIGDGIANLHRAWKLLGEIEGVTLLALSSPYRTRPEIKKEWAREGHSLSDRWFTNAAGALETRLSPIELLEALQGIEKKMGRDRRRSVDRTVDLDILYFDDLVMDEQGLTLPHPGIGSRIFVLAPLAEIAPDSRHPANGMTTRQMYRELDRPTGNDLRRLAWEPQPHRRPAR